MITTERQCLKCQGRLEQLIESVRKFGREGLRIDEVERSVLSELLQMGRLLLEGFIKSAGDGDVGPTLTVPAVAEDSGPAPGDAAPGVRTWRRLKRRHGRSDVSIFGKLVIRRRVYGTREGQKIEAVPLTPKTHHAKTPA